jgi:hypothetical protein
VLVLDTVFVDCVAEWVEDEAENERVWHQFHDTPVPLDWGRQGMAGYGRDRWRNPVFTPLRLSLWRVQVCAGINTRAGI